jgi:hypothetical protein
VFTNETANQILGRSDDLVERDQTRLGDFLAGDGEQLLGESGTLFSGHPNLFDMLTESIAEIQTRREQVAVEENAGKQVVEIMGYPACESADDLHFFRLAELLLDTPARSGVFQHRD